mgnify:FL=1
MIQDETGREVLCPKSRVGIHTVLTGLRDKAEIMP